MTVDPVENIGIKSICVLLNWVLNCVTVSSNCPLRSTHSVTVSATSLIGLSVFLGFLDKPLPKAGAYYHGLSCFGKINLLYSKIFAIFRIYRERKLAHFTSILYLSLSFCGELCVHGDTKCAHTLHTTIKLSLTTGIYMIS